MERKNLSSSQFISSLAAKRRLTSLCGILLVVSIIFASNAIDVSAHTENNLNASKDLTFKGIILTLNVVFLFAFLASTLSIIKNEDNNQNKNFIN
ncbi:MAG: hypothetical protein REI64_06610 [Pedobacter sp.]|uniref:hypothetical protein n=1 Tax=Pedobacter sp. TaxID=1411316 RepID=UPI0028075B32|nr:hypothetical protein [Pedobacter sp.]MDQ8004456.1 hypothetical protein [Pedobacter sp.]